MKTTQEERDLLRLGWDRNGPLCRAINDADRLETVENRIQEIMEKCERRGLKNGRNYGMEDVAADLRAILVSPNPREVSGERYK